MCGELWTKNEKELTELFDELVPPVGKAESKAGEIIRAVNRIIYRFFNDGDHIGIGYGKETLNAPARFLLMETNANVSNIITHLWGLPFTNEYERYLDYLGDAVIELLKTNPELRSEPTKDMFDYSDEIEDVDDSDEEDEYWEEDDWEEE